jgi:hypothetical protein
MILKVVGYFLMQMKENALKKIKIVLKKIFMQFLIAGMDGYTG